MSERYFQFMFPEGGYAEVVTTTEWTRETACDFLRGARLVARQVSRRVAIEQAILSALSAPPETTDGG